MPLQVQVLTQVALSCVAAVVIGQCRAAESVREGVRAGISTELQREDSLDPLWHSTLPTLPTGWVTKGWAGHTEPHSPSSWPCS